MPAIVSIWRSNIARCRPRGKNEIDSEQLPLGTDAVQGGAEPFLIHFFKSPQVVAIDPSGHAPPALAENQVLIYCIRP